MGQSTKSLSTLISSSLPTVLINNLCCGQILQSDDDRWRYTLQIHTVHLRRNWQRLHWPQSKYFTPKCTRACTHTHTHTRCLLIYILRQTQGKLEAVLGPNKVKLGSCLKAMIWRWGKTLLKFVFKNISAGLPPRGPASRRVKCAAPSGVPCHCRHMWWTRRREWPPRWRRCPGAEEGGDSEALIAHF